MGRVPGRVPSPPTADAPGIRVAAPPAAPRLTPSRERPFPSTPSPTHRDPVPARTHRKPRRTAIALWLPALFTAGLGWSRPALLAAEEPLAAVVDPWPGGGDRAALLLTVPRPASAPGALALELEFGGRSTALPLPGSLPARIEIDAAALAIDPWTIPAGGEPLRYRVIAPEGIAAAGESCLHTLTARESLERLLAAAGSETEPLRRAHALAHAARLALDLGQPAAADPCLADLGERLRALPAAASRDALAFEHALLEARLARAYDDADPRHRDAALARLERIAAGATDGTPAALRAERALLLAEGAIERLVAARTEAERRDLLDRARALGRSARESAAGTAIGVPAELLWARVAIERAWRTEARETLDRIAAADPRRAARVAELRARLAAVERDPAARARELETAAAALERIRDRLGAPEPGDLEDSVPGALELGALELDAGVLRLHGDLVRARIAAAAERGDARAALAAIEAGRPRHRAAAESDAIDRALAAIPPGATLLALAEGDGTLVTVRAGAGTLAVHAVPAPPGETARRVATLLRSRGEDAVAALWLAERLIEPHRGALTSVILLAPLGVLRPIPFDALRLDGRFLCETHEVATIPDLAALLRPAPEGGGAWLALADPATDYDGDGAPDRPALPAARDETAPWAALGEAARLRIGAEAREATLRAEGASASVIHLACHGEHEPHRPMRSRLLLAPGEGEDGRITAAELAALDLGRAALVTLSGCETGLTRALGGDDLAGFPRAVLESGAAAFLGSLWPVEDDSAGAFLRDFHARFRAGGDAAAALRAARLEALADPARRDPRHWAPWILLMNAGRRAEDER